MWPCGDEFLYKPFVGNHWGWYGVIEGTGFTTLHQAMTVSDFFVMNPCSAMYPKQA